MVAVLRVLLRVDVPALPLLPQPQLRQRSRPRHHLRLQVIKGQQQENHREEMAMHPGSKDCLCHDQIRYRS